MRSGKEFQKVINDIAEKFNLTLPTPTMHHKMVSSNTSEELALQDVEIFTTSHELFKENSGTISSEKKLLMQLLDPIITSAKLSRTEGLPSNIIYAS